jgi:hypothetical protein
MWWQVLLGAAISLVSTLLAQWFSLSYQTKRQWEMRKADFRRTTLLQLRDALNDLGHSVGRVFILQGEALQRTGSWEAFSSHHPDVAAVSAAVNPVLLHSIAVKDEPLRLKIHSMTERAEAAAKAPSERDADEEREKFGREMSEVIALLGEQLRRLS